MTMYYSLYQGDDNIIDFNDKAFPNYSVSADKHKERKEIWKSSGSELRDSIKEFLVSPEFELVLQDYSNLSLGAERAFDFYQHNDFLCAHDFANVPFGAVNTLEKSGCLAFTSYHLLRFLGYQVNFNDLVSSITTNGYRSWHFTGDSPHLTYTKSDAHDFTLDELKSNYPAWSEFQSCSDLEEAFELLGEPVGIGGATAYFDNLISYINPNIPCYEETRLTDVYEIFFNITREKCIPVPVSVRNAIYYGDNAKNGGHYVLIVGLKYDKFAIVDSNKRELSWVPVRTVLEAMIACKDPCLTFAIDAELLAYTDEA